MAILIGIGAISGMLFLTILRGWVLNVLWAWFIVPAFNVNQINIALAIGLVMTANLIVKAPDNGQPKEGTATEKMINSFSFSFFLSFVALGSGFVVKQFV